MENYYIVFLAGYAILLLARLRCLQVLRVLRSIDCMDSAFACGGID